jgi:transcriptional regulator with XRE-family HTH domain
VSRIIEIGARLKATRDALGLTGTEFGNRARIAQNAYSQYETGKRMLTISAAMRLCATYGLTMDWLFRGDVSTLPHSLAAKLVTIPGHSAGPSVQPQPIITEG